MVFRGLLIFISYLLLTVNTIPLNKEEEAFKNDLFNVMREMKIENKQKINKIEFKEIMKKLLGAGAGEGNTNEETEEVFERVYNKVLSKLPEEIEVNTIPDILKPKPLTDLFLEVLGEIEVGEDNTFNNKTDGYGTDEVIVPEKKKEGEESQVNSDL